MDIKKIRALMDAGLTDEQIQTVMDLEPEAEPETEPEAEPETEPETEPEDKEGARLSALEKAVKDLSDAVKKRNRQTKTVETVQEQSADDVLLKAFGGDL